MAKIEERKRKELEAADIDNAKIAAVTVLAFRIYFGHWIATPNVVLGRPSTERQSQQKVRTKANTNKQYENTVLLSFDIFWVLFVHPTRLIVYSTIVSRNLEGYFWGCLRLLKGIFDGYFGGVLGGFRRF